jgi:hypothetical protein
LSNTIYGYSKTTLLILKTLQGRMNVLTLEGATTFSITALIIMPLRRTIKM